MIGDPELKISKLYGMLPATAGRRAKVGPPPTTRRSATSTSIGPDKKIKLVISYPMSTGRNFDEVLRVIDSMQLTAKHKVATPVNWKDGDDVIILPAVTDAEAKEQVSGTAGTRRSRTCGSSRSRAGDGEGHQGVGPRA